METQMGSIFYLLFLAGNAIFNRFSKQSPNEEQEFLKAVDRRKLSKEEAKQLYHTIKDHKQYLGERLQRDVGMRVAIIDYFENVYQTK